MPLVATILPNNILTLPCLHMVVFWPLLGQTEGSALSVYSNRSKLLDEDIGSLFMMQVWLVKQ